jgi:hypothetical protein
MDMQHVMEILLAMREDMKTMQKMAARMETNQAKLETTSKRCQFPSRGFVPQR